MATGGVFGYHETDSEDELPTGWEERTTLDGKVYYVSHVDQETQWVHPRSGKQKELVGDLPDGWESTMQDGKQGFLHAKSGKFTLIDPRIVSARQITPSSEGIRHRFDGSSRAGQVLHGVDLSGKYVLITGATAGIGLETAKWLAIHNATVIIAARDLSRAEKAKNQILSYKASARVNEIECDLASLKSVRRCALEYRSKGWPLHVLILNAGICCGPFELTEDGYESTFQVNHLSHFYLTELLRPVLTASKPSRVVIVSSESHRFAGSRNFLSPPPDHKTMSLDSLSPRSQSEYWWNTAYNYSKMLNVWMAISLNRQLQGKGVSVNACHPGSLISTELLRHSCALRALLLLLRPFTKTLEQGAATTCLLAGSPDVEGIGGEYFNNCWRCDPDPVALDERLQRRLWDISVRAVERALGDAAWID